MDTKHTYKLVERLGELVRAGARQALAVDGLQPVQLEVLHYLSICNKYSDSPMAVTEYLGQTKGTVSQTIKVLENKGLLKKAPDANDKRKSHLIVTREGKRVLEGNIPPQLFGDAFERLSKQEQAQVGNALGLLLSSMIQANGQKSFGVCNTCQYHQSNEDGTYFCQLVKAPLAKPEIGLICREHEQKLG